MENIVSKTILYVNPKRDAGLRITKKVADMLEKRGLQYAICDNLDALSGEINGAELVITFGGDGTILHCARAIARYNIPILGVNLGSKGFMAELEASEVGLLSRAFDGEYRIERRMTLDVTVRRGEETHSDFALNDVVINGMARVIGIEVSGDGKPIMRFSGDGIIVAAPTGSTAYSMAAGGPIVEPDAENIIVTPICPHLLHARSYVLAPNRLVTVRISGLDGKKAFLSCDGGEELRLLDGDVAEIRKSRLAVLLARITDRSFYENVSGKLS